jgi:hypothetical protein
MSVPRVADDQSWERDEVRLSTGVAIPVRATARRRSWEALPRAVQAAIEAAAGSRVRRATSAGTGFTAGFASRLDLRDGDTIFVKAASTADDRVHGWDISGAYRAEARNLALLPADFGAIPLLWTLSLIEAGEDWVVLGFAYIAGRPPRRPWRPDELQRVTDRLGELAGALEHPPAALSLAPFASVHGDFDGWIERVRERDGDSSWLNVVSDLAGESVERCSGSAMAHLDLRDDNVLLGDDGRVWICDWNWPLLAAPWLDLVTLLISARGDGFDADAVLTSHPLTRDIEGRSVDGWLAHLWLYFTTRREAPVPHGSPHLRDHQAWYAEVTHAWLRARLDQPDVAVSHG